MDLKTLYKIFGYNFRKHARKDVEVALNICVKDYMIYLDDYVIGHEDRVHMIDNQLTIGTFHTHVNTNQYSWAFSRADVSLSVNGRERFIFLLVDNDMYGLDMDRFSKVIGKYKRKEISLYKLTEIINDRKVVF